MGDILVAFDGSEYAYKALNKALNLLKEGDHLVIVYVIPSAILEEFAETAPDVSKAEAQEIINKALSEVKGKGIQATGIIREGDAAEEILRIAEELEASLIVIGPKGLSKIGRFTLGSVADKITRHATRPVLVVR